MKTMTGTAGWAALENEYCRIAGSGREEDVVRCKALKRELEKLTTVFLEEHDEPRSGRGAPRAGHPSR